MAAAAEYDGSNRGAVAEFVSFLESHAVQESEASGVVRVMTVFTESKGLTFDMSVVTGLAREGCQRRRHSPSRGGEPPTSGMPAPIEG